MNFAENPNSKINTCSEMPLGVISTIEAGVVNFEHHG